MLPAPVVPESVVLPALVPLPDVPAPPVLAAPVAPVDAAVAALKAPGHEQLTEPSKLHTCVPAQERSPMQDAPAVHSAGTGLEAFEQPTRTKDADEQ